MTADMSAPVRLGGAGLRWSAPPVAAAVLAGILLYVLPASGPTVYVTWRTVDTPARERLERRLHLTDPTHMEETTWGYILTDTSEENVSRLLALEGNPAQVAGLQIIRLAGPFAIQSLIGLLVGGLLIAGAAAPTTRTRQMYFLVAAGILATSWWMARLPNLASHVVGNWMGDVDTYTEDRHHFQAYFGYDDVRFQYHLGGFVLNLIDRALGSTEASARAAFQLLSGLAGVLALLEAALVAALAGWSPRAMRYAGLCVAAPYALMFFGYQELGYLSLSVAAFPLLFLALERMGEPANGMRLISATGFLQGLHAALHGLGLIGVASSLAMIAASVKGVRHSLSPGARFFVWASTAYLIWLPLYLIVLGLPIVPGHSSGIAFRPVFESSVAHDRVIAPLVSNKALRDIGAEALIVGVPVVLLAVAAASRGLERRAALAGAAVSGVFLLFLWPAQGLAVDMDIVLATFPAFFAAAWICAGRPRMALAALATLAIGHAVFWQVVRSNAFVNRPL